MLPRAHAKNFSDARQHDDKEKIYHKILLLRPKATIVIFFTFVVFLLVFVAAAKKCCQNVAQQQTKNFVSKIFLKNSFQRL